MPSVFSECAFAVIVSGEVFVLEDTSFIAFKDDEGSKVAWLFGPGDFSAVRGLRGDWTSPAPVCKAGDFEDGYSRVKGAEADALLAEARSELGLDKPARVSSAAL